MRIPGLGGGGALGWRRAVAGDVQALSAFLSEDEERRVGFSGRLLRMSALGGPSFRLPNPLRGAVWLMDRPVLAGAALCHPSRLVYPIFPADGPRHGSEADGDLALLASSFTPASVIGMARDVLRYEAALKLSPLASVDYRVMAQAANRVLDPPSAPPPGLILRRARPEDLEALLPLQEAYEIEEVLTPVHRFNAPACRAALARALERQLIFAAEEGGVIVAKAGTNARGFRVDQIGGVYTLPARRGRGIAAALMGALLAEIRRQGRRPALFVKPDNAPARALYRGLGFEDRGDYRADYLEV